MFIRDILVCDDVRNEIGNKLSSMGLYNDEIVFQIPKGSPDLWPKVIRLAFIIRAEMEQTDITQNISGYELTAFFNQKPIVKNGGTLTPEAKIIGKLNTFGFVHPAFLFESSGLITFEMKCIFESKTLDIPDITRFIVKVLSKEV